MEKRMEQLQNKSKMRTFKILFFIILLCLTTNVMAKTKKKHKARPKPKHENVSPIYLEDYKRKFSSLDEEYILADLLKTIPNIEKYYVDIGAGDGIGGSNTAALALHHWRGLACEADNSKASSLLQAYQNLNTIKLFVGKVTPLNVCELFKSNNVPKDFGVLSLDIDSYDYFVLESILENFRPTVLIVEINEKIPPPLEFTVLYNEAHCWDYSHFFGQSICQLEKLALAQNYAIATLEYNNIFLVAKERFQGKSLTAEEAYKTGYVIKRDRAEKFPWNHNMEVLLTSKPDDSIKFLKEYFSAYEGNYILKNPTSTGE